MFNTRTCSMWFILAIGISAGAYSATGNLEGVWHRVDARYCTNSIFVPNENAAYELPDGFTGDIKIELIRSSDSRPRIKITDLSSGIVSDSGRFHAYHNRYEDIFAFGHYWFAQMNPMDGTWTIGLTVDLNSRHAWLIRFQR